MKGAITEFKATFGISADACESYSKGSSKVLDYCVSIDEVDVGQNLKLKFEGKSSDPYVESMNSESTKEFFNSHLKNKFQKQLSGFYNKVNEQIIEARK
jgi:hypothetical protein